MSSPLYLLNSGTTRGHVFDQRKVARAISPFSTTASPAEKWPEVINQPCKYRDKCQLYNCMYIHHHPRGREKETAATGVHAAKDYDAIPGSYHYPQQASYPTTSSSSFWALPPTYPREERPDYVQISRQTAHDEYLAKKLDHKLNHRDAPARCRPRDDMRGGPTTTMTTASPAGGILSQWWGILTNQPTKPDDRISQSRYGSAAVAHQPRNLLRQGHHGYKHTASYSDAWSDDLPHKPWK